MYIVSPRVKGNQGNITLPAQRLSRATAQTLPVELKRIDGEARAIYQQTHDAPATDVDLKVEQKR